MTAGDRKWSEVRVPAEGPKNARIMLIGEAPGECETNERRPFVGGAGKLLDGILQEAQIERGDCYVTNVVKYQPDKNNFEVFYKTEEGRALREKSQEELWKEIRSVRPNVIVPLGNEALHAVMGLSGIVKYRGSILSIENYKVIPTYHPAAVMRQWEWRPIAVMDLKRVQRESGFPWVCRSDYTLKIASKIGEALYCLEALRKEEAVSFDIETAVGQITAVGFCACTEQSVCIPIWFKDSGSVWTVEEEVLIWKAIKDLLEDEKVKKIAQNGQYDVYWLAQEPYKIKVKNMYHDTMIAAHTLYPELPKGLDFLCSMYTDMPYYKDEIVSESAEEYFRYNAKDALATYKVFVEQEKELVEGKMYDFFHAHSMALFEPLMEMSLRGIKVDMEERKRLQGAYKQEIKELYEVLNTQVGHELNVNSPKQMTDFLYEELKLPVKYKVRKGKDGRKKTVTTDKDALHQLGEDFPDVEVLQTILAIREREKILSTYLNGKVDTDGRMRATYDLTGTDTGRLSSSSNPKGTGLNLQNQPPAVKSMYVPDEGKVFIEADLKQAEAYIVAYTAEDMQLIKAMSQGGDIHTTNAANIFRVPVEQVTKEMRSKAKKATHSMNYGIKERTLAKDLKISVKEATSILNMCYATYPRIKVWHLQIAGELRRTRTLVTPLGRRRQFLGHFNDDMLRSAYAFIPQSTIGDLLNVGLLWLWREISDRGLDIQIVAQVHDSILLQCREEMVDEAKELIETHIRRTLKIKGREVTIPVDVKVGKTWKETK